MLDCFSRVHTQTNVVVLIFSQECVVTIFLVSNDTKLSSLKTRLSHCVLCGKVFKHAIGSLYNFALAYHHLHFCFLFDALVARNMGAYFSCQIIPDTRTPQNKNVEVPLLSQECVVTISLVSTDTKLSSLKTKYLPTASSVGKC